MRFAQTLAVSGLAACVSGHGVVTSIQGANGVEMPGLSVADGTPRDCSSNGCGSQADTAIIRDRDIAAGGSPLGRTQGNGDVLAETMIANFMGEDTAPRNNGTGVGEEDQIDQGILNGGGKAAGATKAAGAKNANKRGNVFTRQLQNLLGGLLGGGAGGANAKGEKNTPAAESMVAATAGQGASSGLPTCADSGEITMTFRQINQDGAGPLEAAVDGTSGGTDAAAFKDADVSANVPGLVAGISTATTTDFPITVMMPAGMTCDATVAGVANTCVVRVRNNTPAGPFGGSAAFTQTPAARKRAIAYRLKKRQEEQRRRRSFTA